MWSGPRSNFYTIFIPFSCHSRFSPERSGGECRCRESIFSVISASVTLSLSKGDTQEPTINDGPPRRAAKSKCMICMFRSHPATTRDHAARGGRPAQRTVTQFFIDSIIYPSISIEKHGSRNGEKRTYPIIVYLNCQSNIFLFLLKF